MNAGEVVISGPCVSANYYKEDYKNKFYNDTSNKWLRTGDVARISDDNNMHIIDRCKDLIRINGEWLSSIDMENYVMQLMQIKRACAVGIYDAKLLTEVPILIIQLEDNQSISEKEIIDYIKRKYSDYQIPHQVLFWKELPMKGNKLLKQKVRDKLKSSNMRSKL